MPIKKKHNYNQSQDHQCQHHDHLHPHLGVPGQPDHCLHLAIPSRMPTNIIDAESRPKNLSPTELAWQGGRAGGGAGSFWAKTSCVWVYICTAVAGEAVIGRLPENTSSPAVICQSTMSVCTTVTSCGQVWPGRQSGRWKAQDLPPPSSQCLSQ